MQGPRRDGPGVLHEPFGDVPEANLFGEQLTTASDGSFEIYVGGEQQRPELASHHRWLTQAVHPPGFRSWDERPARMRIERVGMDVTQARAHPGVDDRSDGLGGCFVTGLMDDWPEFPFRYGGVDGENPNRFPARARPRSDAKRGRAAANMHWVLAPDEALIIEFDAHDGLWMLTNMGVFFTSMDYPLPAGELHAESHGGGQRRQGAAGPGAR